MADKAGAEKSDISCHLCGNAMYMLWIDTEPHNNVCPLGAKVVTDCAEAMSRAADTARWIKAGVPVKGAVKPPATPSS